MNTPQENQKVFNGPDLTTQDHKRLSTQNQVIFKYMKDGTWRTLYQISRALDYPESSVSAQLRHLRKERFGSHIVNRRRINTPSGGTYEYQLIINQNGKDSNITSS